MQRKQGGLVPVAETLADLHGPVTATRDASLNSHSLPLSGPSAAFSRQVGLLSPALLNRQDP